MFKSNLQFTFKIRMENKQPLFKWAKEFVQKQLGDEVEKMIKLFPHLQPNQIDPALEIHLLNIVGSRKKEEAEKQKNSFIEFKRAMNQERLLFYQEIKLEMKERDLDKIKKRTNKYMERCFSRVSELYKMVKSSHITRRALQICQMDCIYAVNTMHFAKRYIMKKKQGNKSRENIAIQKQREEEHKNKKNLEKDPQQEQMSPAKGKGKGMSPAKKDLAKGKNLWEGLSPEKEQKNPQKKSANSASPKGSKDPRKAQRSPESGRRRV